MCCACASKPTMKVNHAEVSGVQFGFPPSLSLQMTVVLDVTNPNDYDVAVRAMRGQVTYMGKYPQPIQYQAPGDGVWMAANKTTQVRVPVSLPIDLAMQLMREAMTGVVKYHVTGKADVTATKTLKIEKDNYEVDEDGTFARQQIEASVAALGIPFMR
jgi:hypothetical protein